MNRLNSDRSGTSSTSNCKEICTQQVASTQKNIEHEEEEEEEEIVSTTMGIFFDTGERKKEKKNFFLGRMKMDGIKKYDFDDGTLQVPPIDGNNGISVYEDNDIDLENTKELEDDYSLNDVAYTGRMEGSGMTSFTCSDVHSTQSACRPLDEIRLENEQLFHATRSTADTFIFEENFNDSSTAFFEESILPPSNDQKLLYCDFHRTQQGLTLNREVKQHQHPQLLMQQYTNSNSQNNYFLKSKLNKSEDDYEQTEHLNSLIYQQQNQWNVTFPNTHSVQVPTGVRKRKRDLQRLMRTLPHQQDFDCYDDLGNSHDMYRAMRANLDNNASQFNMSPKQFAIPEIRQKYNNRSVKNNSNILVNNATFHNLNNHSTIVNDDTQSERIIRNQRRLMMQQKLEPLSLHELTIPYETAQAKSNHYPASQMHSVPMFGHKYDDHSSFDPIQAKFPFPPNIFENSVVDRTINRRHSLPGIPVTSMWLPQSTVALPGDSQYSLERRPTYDNSFTELHSSSGQHHEFKLLPTYQRRRSSVQSGRSLSIRHSQNLQRIAQREYESHQFQQQMRDVHLSLKSPIQNQMSCESTYATIQSGDDDESTILDSAEEPFLDDLDLQISRNDVEYYLDSEFQTALNTTVNVNEDYGEDSKIPASACKPSSHTTSNPRVPGGSSIPTQQHNSAQNDLRFRPHKLTRQRLVQMQTSKLFPVKLARAIHTATSALQKKGNEDCGLDDDVAVAWLRDGRSFVIIDPEKFVKNVLQPVFHNNDAMKYDSFLRKLHRWGFRRLAGGTGMDCFYHPDFHRDYPERAAKIQSITNKASHLASSTTATRSDDVDGFSQQKPPCLDGIRDFFAVCQAKRQRLLRADTNETANDKNLAKTDSTS